MARQNATIQNETANFRLAETVVDAEPPAPVAKPTLHMSK